MNPKSLLKYSTLFFYFGGLIILAVADWKIALGVAMMIQSNYLSHYLDKDYWKKL